MYINDDADLDTVVKETVAALNESTRHLGKADQQSLSQPQAHEIKQAIARLEEVIRFKGIKAS